jgi:class 3 adenylate cyclase
MCQFFGLAQGWWSVAGLAADLAGFSLLALDVTREYGRHRLVERFRVGATAAERFAKHRLHRPRRPPMTL